jgi:protein farnesyltransferase/geranylgeranyltransferase type-1 subunit alpha
MADWENVTLPAYVDTATHTIVPIAYPEEYREAMAYFWYAYEKCELSERVFQLTTKIIDMCEGHYTVWYNDYVLLISQAVSEETSPRP